MRSQSRTTRTALAALSLLAVLAAALTAAPAVAQEPPPEEEPEQPEQIPDGPDADPSVDLEGPWRFATGDDQAWADPAFDDSDWEEVPVPDDGGQDIFDDYDGYAWFRKTFELPADAEGVNLVAALGGIDDADETYLNGVRIGSTGTFPPDSDSQWFEQRQYPVAADAPVYGGTNVLAVRMNDFTGGGGWYAGPVGLFSKDRLREELFGLSTTPAAPAEAEAVRAVLERQSEAVAAGDVDGYLATLDPDYFHDGDTRDRRGRELAAQLASVEGLQLVDTEVEVLRTAEGDLLVDTNRSLVAGDGAVLDPPGQELLTFDPTTGLEVGNRSRFFRDAVQSEVEGMPREYAVYLPPSYLEDDDRRYPTVYLFHGINGGAREWEPRDIRAKIDAILAEAGLAESIVIMPDGESLWYIDSSDAPWRTMFTTEMVPQVDAEYRTLPQREFRGVTGVSMGGHGAFTVAWSNPDLFSSIASHMGALDLPPLAGSAAEIAANSDETPNAQVNRHTPDFLDDWTYFFDACEEDDFRFDDAVRAMDAQLTSKLVEHTAVVYPEGRHNDECWVPRLVDSFQLHSDRARGNELVEPRPETDTVERVAGPGRIGTAVALSQRAFPDSAESVVLARADAFPDALTASTLAAEAGGPLLLTSSDGLSEEAAAEITRLGASRAYLAGGTAALSPAVESDVGDLGVEAVRVSGDDRAATAAAVAETVVELGGPVDSAVVVAGDRFPDALAAGGLAAGRRAPILLAGRDGLDSGTSDALDELLDDGAEVVIGGGSEAVGDTVADELSSAGLVPRRVGGVDRYATAVLLAAEARAAGASSQPTVLASGADFPDALAASVAAHRLGGVLLLADPSSLRDSGPTAASLRLARRVTDTAIVAGGVEAVEDAVVEDVAAAIDD